MELEKDLMQQDAALARAEFTDMYMQSNIIVLEKGQESNTKNAKNKKICNKNSGSDNL